MNQSNQAGQGSIGAYGTFLGYNGSITLSFDGVIQVSSMPQVSAGITTAVNTPIATGTIADFFTGNAAWGPNKSNAQPSAWTGIGTPTGLPGPTFSVLQNVNAPQISVQFGKALMNDMIEAGVSLTLPTNKQPVGTWINEFTGLPGYTQIPNTTTPTQTTPGYRGAGFNDPRLNANISTTVSTAAANAAQIAKTTQAASQAAQAQYNAAQEAKYAAIGGDYYTPGEPITYSDNYDSYASERNSGSSSAPSDDSFESDWSAATGGFFPIVIDLDGDGVELRPLSSSATFFDTDSDNYQERTAWAGADDGILVIDLDGDGQVTQAKEIAFAEWTEEQDSDLQALAKVFDSNQDGVFDSQDERFAEFRIWKDANSNGVPANAPQFYLIA